MLVSRRLLLITTGFVLVLILFGGLVEVSGFSSNNGSMLAGMEIHDHLTFNSVVASATHSPSGCDLQSSKATATLQEELDQNQGGDSKGEEEIKKTMKLHLKHRSANQANSGKKDSVIKSAHSDLARIQTLHRRITEKKNQNVLDRSNNKALETPSTKTEQKQRNPEDPQKGKLIATVESGVSLGSGEYLMDVFVGTPPKHFSLILDTGSDLNWLQCLPCHDCFKQTGPHYDPKHSSSFRNISCKDPRCHLVSSPDPPQPCKSESQTCPYFYWYGDHSNTTGDFALETFTVNLTMPKTGQTGNSAFSKVENVMFGCGHWNRGLFHGASGLVGLGKGPLSFTSQLKSVYGESFSYCLVDRNSDMSVSSKLIFGEDESLMRHPDLKFTSFVGGKDNPVDTFYYVQIKSVVVGGEVLKIPEETWKISSEGAGGAIIDSGTTLSYFADPAYEMIKEAFVKKVRRHKNYPVVSEFPLLSPCYNVTGVGKVELPDFAIVFEDRAVWKFPLENYFIKLEPEEIVCLAILGTQKSSLSILGNYQQQNFHVLYDTKNSRLGYAPMKCADV
ncbi:hypothetical protein Scep_012086 [Stephania cephalantha]|uniref:Peptidase A1 domain-containing protein n=1 Tax=Stephania cephalantha TaxID=152367 RepID=A0AAP0JGB4_9MAGN